TRGNVVCGVVQQAGGTGPARPRRRRWKGERPSRKDRLMTSPTSPVRTRTAPPAAPPFNWSRFLMYLASLCVVILLAGLLVGMAVGMRPLEARAAQTVSHKAVSIEITWPVIAKPVAKPKPGAKATQAKEETPRTWLPQQQQEELRALAQSAYQGT